MATSHIQTKCSICNQETCTFICTGCSTAFCFHHLIEHRQTLQTKLNEIQNDFNQFKETIIQQINHPEKRLAIEKIDQWEINSIDKIKQTAKEYRQILINYTNTILKQIENKLNDPNEQTITIQGKFQFNEIHFNKGQVAVRPFFCPKYFLKRITYSESASNSE
jgi:superoxide dismutase